MRGIFFFSIFIIIYGSLFPFDFHYVDWEHEGRKMLFSTSVFGGKFYDIINNILLFMPLGFAGSELISRNNKNQTFYIYLCFFSFLLALAIQILQIYIPQRTPAFYDVLWNMVGTFSGILIANYMQKKFSHILGCDNKISLFLLLSSWIFFLLVPFVFVFKIDTFSENLSSHLNIEKYQIANILMYSGSWIIFERLINETTRIRRKTIFSFEILFLFTTILKIFILKNTIEPNIFAGGIIAIILTNSVFYKRVNPHHIAILFLLPTMFYNSLYPFDFIHNSYQDFFWIPFGEIFSPNILGSLRTISFKFYIYGALVWSFYKSFPNTKWPPYFLFLYAVCIELLQHQTLFRIGGLTEPILVLLLCYFLPRESVPFKLHLKENNANG